jgi:hypothetical protein
MDPDDALKVALKAAVDAGQWDRVRGLTEMLANPPKGAAPVVELATRRKLEPT